jgi:hypothetical protein
MLRRLLITMKTGDPTVVTMMVYRDVRKEDLHHEYNLIVTFPYVESVTVLQDEGENWMDYVQLTNSLVRG